MQAAVAGGVTSLACPPDTDPPLDEPGLVEMLKYRARSLNQAHVYPLGALTADSRASDLTEMAELPDAGCVAFSQADAPLADTQVLLRALQYAATFGFAVWLRPQDALSRARRRRPRRRGRDPPRPGRRSRPAPKPSRSATILALARETGARVHLCRLSTREGVAMVRAGEARRARR